MFVVLRVSQLQTCCTYKFNLTCEHFLNHILKFRPKVGKYFI